MKAGIFCVCESRLSHRSPIFFLQTEGGQLRVTRHAHVSLHNAGNHNVQFFKSLTIIVCRLLRVTVPGATFGSNDRTAP